VTQLARAFRQFVFHYELVGSVSHYPAVSSRMFEKTTMSCLLQHGTLLRGALRCLFERFSRASRGCVVNCLGAHEGQGLAD
jgi:hypothetical protein